MDIIPMMAREIGCLYGHIPGEIERPRMAAGAISCDFLGFHLFFPVILPEPCFPWGPLQY
jgi:hypothetical protein